MDMTVPVYRAGTGPQPDPYRHAARVAVDDLFLVHNGRIGFLREMADGGTGR